jgi:hypothetical protein
MENIEMKAYNDKEMMVHRIVTGEAEVVGWVDFPVPTEGDSTNKSRYNLTLKLNEADAAEVEARLKEIEEEQLANFPIPKAKLTADSYAVLNHVTPKKIYQGKGEPQLEGDAIGPEYVKLGSKAEDANGEDTFPRVVDAGKNPIAKSDVPYLRAGDKVAAIFNIQSYYDKKLNKLNIYQKVSGLQILDHEDTGGEAADFEARDGGFTAGSAESQTPKNEPKPTNPVDESLEDDDDDEIPF